MRQVLCRRRHHGTSSAGVISASLFLTLPRSKKRLYIPSILVNPKSKEQAARESYIAQQREHGLAQARKRQDDKVGKVGKRRERRRENGETER